MAGTVGLALEHFHEVRDEEVVLQGGHPLLREDGGLAADGAGEGQALGRDVVLETPVQGGKRRVKMGARPWQKAEAGRAGGALSHSQPSKGSSWGGRHWVSQVASRPSCTGPPHARPMLGAPALPTSCGHQRFWMNRHGLATASTSPAHPSCGLFFLAATPNKDAASVQRMVSVNKVMPHPAEDWHTKSFASLNTLKFPALHAVLEESEPSYSRPWPIAWKAGRGAVSLSWAGWDRKRTMGLLKQGWASSDQDLRPEPDASNSRPGSGCSQAKGKQVLFPRGGGVRVFRVPPALWL